VWIADTDRLGLGIISSKWPTQLPLGDPFSGMISECPFRMRVADVLEQEQLVPTSIGDEAAVRVLRKIWISIPDRQQPTERCLRSPRRELQNFGPGRAAAARCRRKGWIDRQEYLAIRETCQRRRLTRPACLVRLREVPSLRLAFEKCPTTI